MDIKLLHQRAIEAEEEHKREVGRSTLKPKLKKYGVLFNQLTRRQQISEAVEELRGLNTSWSHHRLCDLQRQAARWRHSRPSIQDTKHYRVRILAFILSSKTHTYRY